MPNVLPPVGRDVLDDIISGGCDYPGCDHSLHDGMFLHSRCHLDAGCEVEYKDGTLHIRCVVCKSTILDVVVAATGEG